MKLQLTENKFKNMLTEMVKEVLLESTRGQKEKTAGGYIKQYFNNELSDSESIAIAAAIRKILYTKDLDDTKAIYLLPTLCSLIIPQIFNPDIEELKENITFFDEDVKTGQKDENGNPITKKVQRCKFNYGVIPSSMKVFISTVINYVFDKNKITEFINYYKNNSYDDLWDRRQEFGFDENRYENQNHTYQMVGPFTINGEDDTLSFNEAQEYGDKSADGSKICYTQSEETYSRYLDNGNNVLYIFLRDDWETVPQVHTKCTIFPDHPEWDGYDDYGLSMLFVIINPEIGKLEYCNTRWNHGGKYKPEFDGNVDHVLSIDELKQIVGEELIKSIPIDELLEKITKVQSIGNGLYIACSENGWNIYNKNTKSLVIVNADNQPVWFRNMRQINNRCFQVNNNESLKSVFILDGNGGYKFLTDDKTDNVLWFKEIRFIGRNYFNVENNEGFSTLLIINGIGEFKFLTDNKTGDTLWFKNIFTIKDFDCLVGKEDKDRYCLLISVDKDNGIYRYLTDDKTGNILWFKTIYSLENGYFKIENNNGMKSLLIPIDNGGYRLLTPDEYQQYKNQPLNEIINRLVRNYLRY